MIKKRPPDVYFAPAVIKSSSLRRLMPGTATMIVQSYLPRGWVVRSSEVWNAGRGGLCSFETKTIWCPRIIDTYTLHVFLHEVYHARNHRRAAATNWVSHLREWECETWAMAQLRELGLSIPRRVLANAKEYVRDCILDDRRAGLGIDPAIARWCDPQNGARRRVASAAKRRA